MENSDQQARYEAACKTRRALRAQLLERLDNEEATDLADRLRKCGEEIPLICTGCGDRRIALKRCDIKWCPSCAPALAARTVDRYKGLVADAQWPIFATFTIRNSRDIEIRKIRRAFGKLRRLRWWKRAVKGGVASIELTNTGNDWHPHVHALLDARWLAVTVPEPDRFAPRSLWQSRCKAAAREVAEQWSLCVGEQSRIHVRRIWRSDNGDPTKAAREVLKYSVKGADLIDSEDPIAPALRQLSATRLVTSWGSFFGHPANKRTRSAPKMCPCGCSDAIPEFIADAIAKKSRPKFFRPRS